MADDLRTRILGSLARGDGQMMDGFDLGHTAEIMYGDQADQIELVIATEQRAALKRCAHELEMSARLLRGEPGDRARRSELAAAASRLRAMGRSLTKAAQERYDARRAPRQAAPFALDYNAPQCICRNSGMGRRSDCEVHGYQALRNALCCGDCNCQSGCVGGGS